MKWFDNIRVNKPRLNKFDLSHERKGTGNMGWLYPIFLQETLPGDKVRVQSQVFLRFLALLAPVMHRVDVTVHYFKVPYRLLWANFEDFITGGVDGLTVIVAPKFRVTDMTTTPSQIKTGSLLDHLGFPTIKTATNVNAGYSAYAFSSLPLRAYQLIYDSYYRDQNVQGSVIFAGFKNDGFETVGSLDTISQLRSRCFEKDYLTSVLPWTQRGAPVSVPITSNVTYRKPSQVRRASDDALSGLNTLQSDAAGNLEGITGNIDMYLDNIASISSSSLTINALRASEKLQQWLEANARGGSRYIEQIAMHFGVISSDARLQRPQYLGGGKQPVVISENLQTAPASGGSTPLATLSGHGMSIGSTNQFSTYCEEHCLIMGLMSIVARTSYQESLDRLWTRLINTDYYFPEFAHLGEQPVINGEVYSDWSNAAAVGAWNTTFGYQGRYAEYKYSMSHISGQFRESLGYWTLRRSFAGYPLLNVSFMQASNVPTDIFAVTSDVDHIVWQVFNKVDALRPMPYFSTPSL